MNDDDDATTTSMWVKGGVVCWLAWYVGDVVGGGVIAIEGNWNYNINETVRKGNDLAESGNSEWFKSHWQHHP